MKSLRRVKEIVDTLLRPSGYRQEIPVSYLVAELRFLGYRENFNEDKFNNHYMREKLPVGAISAAELSAVLRVLRKETDCSATDALEILFQIRFSQAEIERVINEIAPAFDLSPAQMREQFDRLRMDYVGDSLASGVITPDLLPEHFRRNLPDAPYSILWGLEKRDDGECEDSPNRDEFAVHKLVRHLQTGSGMHIINVEGIGGIGKTSTVHHAMSLLGIKAGNQFEGLCWVQIDSLDTSRWSTLSKEEMNQRIEKVFNSLCHQLNMPETKRLSLSDKIAEISKVIKDQPYILVFDNLQSPDDLDALAEYIRPIANPSWVVLTCRGSLVDKSKMNVQPFPIQPLSCADTIRMARHEASLPELEIAAIGDAPPGSLQRIYDVTQGHPQAIKVLIGQMLYMNQEMAFGSLERGLGSVKDMYRSIYSSAWNSLSPEAQRMLRKFGLTTDLGIYQEDLQSQLRKLDADQFVTALHELYRRKLINVDRRQADPLYFVHQITYNFLRSMMQLGDGGEFQP